MRLNYFLLFNVLHYGLALQPRQVRSASCEDQDFCALMISDSPSAAVSIDCSSFMTDTTTLAPVTETTVVTTTITPSPVEALLLQQHASENGREPARGDDVPMYAWPCDVDRYAEVCSCLGFPATIITELAWTAIETSTLTKTQTLSGPPVFPNVTRSLASSWQVSIGPKASNTATASGILSVLSSSRSSNQRPTYAPPPLTPSTSSATSSSSWPSVGSSRPSLTPSMSRSNYTGPFPGRNSTLTPSVPTPNYTPSASLSFPEIPTSTIDINVTSTKFSTLILSTGLPNCHTHSKNNTLFSSAMGVHSSRPYYPSWNTGVPSSAQSGVSPSPSLNVTAPLTRTTVPTLSFAFPSSDWNRSDISSSNFVPNTLPITLNLTTTFEITINVSATSPPSISSTGAQVITVTESVLTRTATLTATQVPSTGALASSSSLSDANRTGTASSTTAAAASSTPIAIPPFINSTYNTFPTAMPPATQTPAVSSNVTGVNSTAPAARNSTFSGLPTSLPLFNATASLLVRSRNATRIPLTGTAPITLPNSTLATPLPLSNFTTPLITLSVNATSAPLSAISPTLSLNSTLGTPLPVSNATSTFSSLNATTGYFSGTQQTPSVNSTLILLSSTYPHIFTPTASLTPSISANSSSIALTPTSTPSIYSSAPPNSTTITNSTTASTIRSSTTSSLPSTLTLSYTSNPIPTLNTTTTASSSTTTSTAPPSLVPTPPSLYCPTTSSCRHYTPCNLSPGSTNCICASAANGTGFCLDSDISCVGLSTCSRDSDCVGGGSKKGGTAEGEWVCAIGTCCDSPNVCVRADICGAGGGNGRALAARRLDVDVSVKGLKGRGFARGFGLGAGWWGGEGGTVGGGFIANAAAAGF